MSPENSSFLSSPPQAASYEHRNLAGLAREGESALDKPLRNDVLRRATASAVPSLAAFLVTSALPEARSVAFATIVATQLAQTLDVGWSGGNLTRSVFGAVAGSAGVLVAALTVPPLRNFLNLVIPSPLGWALIGGGTVVAVGLSRVLAPPGLSSQRLALPQPSTPPIALLAPVQTR